MKAARAARAKADAFSPTDGAIRKKLAAAEKRAAAMGFVAKTESAYESLTRKWLRFLATHGEAYGWEECEGPTLEQVKHFTTYCYETRDCYESSAGLKGMGDSYELHIRYFLAKFVFVRLAYPGWIGLGEHALDEKCKPFKKEVREHWKRLKVSDEDMSTTAHPFVKQKWCDTMYFLAQDHDMEKTMDAATMLTRMAVRAHVRITCSRGGSFAKDWWDRAGLQVQYAKRNVLSVKDWTWAREGMVIEQEVVEQAARGQVQINRLKHYYLETYHYDMSVTPDVCEDSKLVVARCASTWLLGYQFARGLFEVQYKGMSTKQRLTSMAARKNGYTPGMPLGAQISAEDAVMALLAGEVAFAPELRSEPAFVQLVGRSGMPRRFGTMEMHTETVGAIFRDAAAPMCKTCCDAVFAEGVDVQPATRKRRRKDDDPDGWGRDHGIDWYLREMEAGRV